jgi:hypothetical protein
MAANISLFAPLIDRRRGSFPLTGADQPRLASDPLAMTLNSLFSRQAVGRTGAQMGSLRGSSDRLAGAIHGIPVRSIGGES